MIRPSYLARTLTAFGLIGFCLTPVARAEQDLATATWVKSTAYAVPKETATKVEGYFSIIEGLNGRLYIGTHANAVRGLRMKPDDAKPVHATCRHRNRAEGAEREIP